MATSTTSSSLFLGCLSLFFTEAIVVSKAVAISEYVISFKSRFLQISHKQALFSINSMREVVSSSVHSLAPLDLSSRFVSFFVLFVFFSVYCCFFVLANKSLFFIPLSSLSDEDILNEPRKTEPVYFVCHEMNLKLKTFVI